MKFDILSTQTRSLEGLEQNTNALECRLETSFEGLDALRSAWDEAVIRLSGSIYMSFDWCRIWWQFYGAGRELRVFIFTAAGQIVAILPCYIDAFGFPPFQPRIARLVGANVPPKAFNPPVQEDWAETIFSFVLARLVENDKVDLFSYGPVSELHRPIPALEKAGRAACLVVKRTPSAECVHSVFTLPSSLDEYFERLSKSERKKRKYELRLLQKESGSKVEVQSASAIVQEEYPKFVEQHGAQWLAEGRLGHFGSWPKAKEYNAALVKAQGELGRVRFIRILAGDRVISNQYVFAFGEWYFWELPARVTGKEWERLSLGAAGLVSTIDSAILEGKKFIEGGLGHYPYKLKMGATEPSVFRVHVFANGSGNRCQIGFLKAGRLALHYLYHKIWYRRITPWLPKWLRRPQWNLWLRFDF